MWTIRLNFQGFRLSRKRRQMGEFWNRSVAAWRWVLVWHKPVQKHFWYLCAWLSLASQTVPNLKGRAAGENCGVSVSGYKKANQLGNWWITSTVEAKSIQFRLCLGSKSITSKNNAWNVYLWLRGDGPYVLQKQTTVLLIHEAYLVTLVFRCLINLS